MENISTKDMETLLSSVFVEQEKMKYYKIVDNIITQHEGNTEIKDGKLRINYSSGPFIFDSAGLKQNKVSIRIIATDTDNIQVSHIPTEGLNKDQIVKDSSQFQVDLTNIFSLVKELADDRIKPVRVFFLYERQFKEEYFIRNQNSVLKLNSNLFKKENVNLALLDIIEMYKEFAHNIEEEKKSA